MGTRFELIADSAIVFDRYNKKCNVCKAEDVPLYTCHGSVLLEDGTIDESQSAYAICEACLKAGRLAHIVEFQTDPIIEQFAADPAGEKELLRRTPHIPLMLQHDDWPLCCGRLAEFMGVPQSYEESIAIPDRYRFWEAGFADWGQNLDVDGVKWTLEPESLDEISKFRCRSCGQGICTWQFT